MRTRLLILIALLLSLLAGIASAAPSRRWPTVEQQLARAHVVPGSALEKLIRANQDTTVLAPWENDDDEIGLPLWLRVLWRKKHPDSLNRADDPNGGYPLVLKEQYEWMVHHQDLRRGKPEPSSRPTKSLTAGSDVRISSPAVTTIPRSESDVRVFPGNNNVIVAACNNIEASGLQLQMYSTDGGSTWGRTTLPRVGVDDFNSDPAVDFTSDGVAWSLTIGVEAQLAALRVRAAHSVGTNYSQWVAAGTPSGSQTLADKELMWIDHSATSPYQNRIYAIWHNGHPSYVSYYNPQTQTWSTPAVVSGADTGDTTGGDIKTNAGGDVFAFWPLAPMRATPGIYMAKSTNGGVSFGSPVKIADTVGSYQIGVPAFNSISGGKHRPLIYPSGGAYQTSTKNLVYAVWMDLNQPGCTAPCPSAGPCTNVTSTCKTRIWFNRSTDGGTVWEAKRMINDSANLNDQFNPRLVVDEATGTLTVMYYDTIQDPNRIQTRVYAQSSTDDGQTWSSPLQVSTASSDESNPTADYQYGDYNGIGGHAGVVFPTWTDKRNAIEEIWTARLTNGSPPPSPTGLVATATSTSQVSLTWSASSGATSYQVQRSSDGGGFQTVATPATASYTDNTVAASKTYVYRVLAVSSSGTSAPSAPDLATTLLFTDDPVTAGVVVKAVHLTQLRQAVNLVRAAAGLGAASFTDATPTLIKAVHISELRSALDPARSAIGVPALTYTDPTLTTGLVVKAAHIQELRNGVK